MAYQLPTAKASVVCNGCSKNFSPRGRTNHWRQTAREECKAAHTAYQALQESLFPGLMAPPNPQVAENLSAENTGVGADYFSESYTPAELGLDNPAGNTADNPRATPMDVDNVFPAPMSVSDRNQGTTEEDEADEEEDVRNFEELGRVLEPVINPNAPQSAPGELPADELAAPQDTSGRLFTPEERQRVEGKLWVHPTIVPFPSESAGAPLTLEVSASQYDTLRSHLESGSAGNIWAPFKSKLDWSMAYWAKTRGPTSTAVSELLQMDELAEKLDLSFCSSAQLNKIIDEQLPGRPKFTMEEIQVGGENFEVYFRDIVPCIRALYGDPEFAQHLITVPERHYQDADMTIRMYDEMNTGTWWWNVQTSIEAKLPGATIIPLIISSDKTQLTLFHGKTAYPVYMTIGNIPKDIRRKPSRRAQVLIGYLPTAKLDHISNKAARRRATGNIFHECMRRILAPIKDIGETGIAMVSGDGVWRRCHPIYAIFVGDYPEQVLVTATLYGDCPRCPILHALLGEYDDDTDLDFRDADDALDVFELADGDPTTYHAACREARLRPIFHPFWEDLPYVNIFASCTPDILHQMYQGVIKHVIAWISDPQAFGPDEIDARCHRMPPNHHARLFTHGISSLVRVSGTEHKHIARILLGLIADLPLPDGRSPARLIRAVRGILDFLYLAQYPSHTDETLAQMDDALRRFHDNKSIFIDLGIRLDFNLPKVHGARHYSPSIVLFGTTDNSNTEQSERLHIDFAKDAYRATNRKDEYPQMTAWLERREKVNAHAAFIQWRSSGHPPITSERTPEVHLHMHTQMTKHPTLPAVSFDRLHELYGAVDFSDALAAFIVKCNYPDLGPGPARHEADNTLIPTRPIAVYHKIKLWNHDALQREDGKDEQDAVHVRPQRRDTRGRIVPGRFDTVLVKSGAGGARGVAGYRVAQVRVVFRLSAKTADTVYLPTRPTPPQHLAYIEWFTPFAKEPEDDTQMYRVSRSVHNGRRDAEIIPIEDIQRSVQLFPRFGATAPRHWTSYNVLEECTKFRVSSFLDHHTYRTVF